MRAEVFSGPELIGVGVLEHLDPPMGVAFGPFTPSPLYFADQHANTVEGNYVGDKGQLLTVSFGEIGAMNIASIAIEDCAASLGEVQLTVWWKDGRDFGALFSEHADFKAYYSSSE